MQRKGKPTKNKPAQGSDDDDDDEDSIPIMSTQEMSTLSFSNLQILSNNFCNYFSRVPSIAKEEERKSDAQSS